MNSLLSTLFAATLAFIVFAASGKAALPNDSLLSICEVDISGNSTTYLMELYPGTEDSSTLGEFAPDFLAYTEFGGFTGIHVNKDQSLWGVALTDFNTLYRFGFTVPLTPGDSATVNTINGALGSGDNSGDDAIFTNLGPGSGAGTSGLNMSDYDFYLWDSISLGGLTGDCKGALYVYDYWNRFLQLYNTNAGTGVSMNAFSPVSPFNLAFVNQFASSNNNHLVSAWLDAGYYSEDSFYVSPLTLYVATMDISKDPPQMSLKTQPFFDYFNVFPYAADNLEVSSDGNYLYMIAYYVGGYVDSNFTEYDRKSLKEDQRRALGTLLKHSEKLRTDYKRNLGLMTRQQKVADAKKAGASKFYSIHEMKRSMRAVMRDLPVSTVQSLITISLNTMEVVQTQDFDSDTSCVGLTLKKNRCYRS